MIRFVQALKVLPVLYQGVCGLPVQLDLDRGGIGRDEEDQTVDMNFALMIIITLVVVALMAVITFIIIVVIGFVRFVIDKTRSVKLSNNIPGEIDDEFEIEERLSELSPNEQHMYRLGQEYIKSNPPFCEEISLSTHMMIQEKGIDAWDFIPDINLPNDCIFVNNKTEINFMSYDYQCSIQTNLPIPKINDVYYFEAKVFSLDSPEDTIVSIGLGTKPYPYFRLPGRHLYSIGYDSDGSRRYSNSFKLTEKESTVFPKIIKGDVVGIGYRVGSGTIFFTRNGKKLSEKSIGGHIRGMKLANLFPTIGSNNPCSVHVNLGQSGYVFIEANIKKWGYASKEGTRPPLPQYNTVENDMLLESSNEDEDEEILDPPDFYELAGYTSRNSFKTNNEVIGEQSEFGLESLLPVQPPLYKEEASDEEQTPEMYEDEIQRNTENNQFLDENNDES